MAADEFVLHDADGGSPLRVRVVPQTVPTSASPFHESVTHVDALGMGVAAGVGGDWPFYPTPCCGAAASISDPEYGMFCKACYAQVDPAFGGVPVEPLRPREEQE